ncbi:hypothetical protein LXA43DRAFT_1009330 [Ganoderma leucocontextum]|nr:hypothetical protein LXA43DRAFT_1009330 [Ganoderma leucocontextum]
MGPGERSEQRRCAALLRGKTRCLSWSDRSNPFCAIHREERWRLVRAYKDAAERAMELKPGAVTTKEQLYAPKSADEAKAAEGTTAEYLEALRAELKGRATVRERFYANGAWTARIDPDPRVQMDAPSGDTNSVQDGHHIRIRKLVNEETIVAALLADLRARTMRSRLPRQPLRPVGVIRGAPVARDREYNNRHYMPVDYGQYPYGQPVGNGGMPGRLPGSPLGDMLLRWIFYAVIGYGIYKVANLMFLEAIRVCREIVALCLAPFTELARLVEFGKLFFGVGEWVQTLGTTIGEQVGNIAAKKLSLPTELSELLKFEEGTLENARKGIVEHSASAWASLSQLAAQGVEAAGDTVASSVNDPGQGVKNVAEGLTEVRGWIVERSGPIWTSFSQLVEDGVKAASDAVACSVSDEVKK